MIVAQIERLHDCLPELVPLFPGHYKKLALNQNDVPLDPQFEVYLERENQGSVCCVTLRAERGVLIGYWVAFIAPGLHYKTCLTAQMDIWNVSPEYEGTMAPMILMRAVEREYKRRGVNRSFVGEKLHRPTGRLLKAFGYEPIETYYSKMVK